jgi:hypothetical protein
MSAFFAFFCGFNSWPEAVLLRKRHWGEPAVILRFCGRTPGRRIIGRCG